MSKIILGYPYSGALYGYFSDQIGQEHSHTRHIGGRHYYTTLYGKNYKSYEDQALLFVLLYDDIWMTPADSPLPKSKLNPRKYGSHPELGLTVDWDSYSNLVDDIDGGISSYIEDTVIRDILKNKFKVPEKAWNMLLSSVVYEANLSREHRCPIACSPGRKLLIDRFIEINRPATHPDVLPITKTSAISGYINATSLSLAPSDLDHLIAVKPEVEVRSYANSFLRMLESYSAEPNANRYIEMLDLAREAIETEKIGTLASGIFSWLGRIFSLVGMPLASMGAKAGSTASKVIADNSRWYELSGQIKRAESNAILIKNIEAQKNQLS